MENMGIAWKIWNIWRKSTKNLELNHNKTKGNVIVYIHVLYEIHIHCIWLVYQCNGLIPANGSYYDHTLQALQA